VCRSAVFSAPGYDQRPSSWNFAWKSTRAVLPNRSDGCCFQTNCGPPRFGSGICSGSASASSGSSGDAIDFFAFFPFLAFGALPGSLGLFGSFGFLVFLAVASFFFVVVWGCDDGAGGPADWGDSVALGAPTASMSANASAVTA